MKDIELAKEYLEKKGFSGFANYTDVPKWMVDFAQQYHQSQLSKLPSDEEIEEVAQSFADATYQMPVKNGEAFVQRVGQNPPGYKKHCQKIKQGFRGCAKWMRGKANNL